MTGSADDKRRAARYSYGHPLTYTGTVSLPGLPPNEVAMRGVIVDVSNSGIGIETKGHAFVEEGAVVQTWIPIAEIPVSIPVMTKVQWVKEKNPGRSQLVGLKFLW